MIERTFGFCTHTVVPEELSHLLLPLDKAYKKGTLHNRVARDVLNVFSAHKLLQKNGATNLANIVMARKHEWVYGLTVDHIDHNPANNEEINLRMVTRQQNNVNRRSGMRDIHAMPPISKANERLLSFEVVVRVDDHNEDLLDELEEKYRIGALTYRAAKALSSYGQNSTSLGIAGRVLQHHNIAIPKSMTIDHIDRDSGNNLLENLRVVSRAENNRNRGRHIAVAV